LMLFKRLCPSFKKSCIPRAVILHSAFCLLHYKAVIYCQLMKNAKRKR
jgi:hypothetical protein